ncbi:hypothetical protein BDE02_05G060100 [Populus trichocarpa]|nr:hypothetical protein BDE02_05G060100 [Populus trichocarpa]
MVLVSVAFLCFCFSFFCSAFFVSQCSSLLLLRLRFLFSPFEIVLGKKAFGLCFRIPLLWTKTMMGRRQ